MRTSEESDLGTRETAEEKNSPERDEDGKSYQQDIKNACKNHGKFLSIA